MKSCEIVRENSIGKIQRSMRAYVHCESGYDCKIKYNFELISNEKFPFHSFFVEGMKGGWKDFSLTSNFVGCRESSSIKKNPVINVLNNQI